MSAPEPLKPAYLICGSDRPKVRRAVGRLRKRVIDETGSDLNLVTFDAETVAAEAVVEAASTPSFTLGTRLLVVFNAHKWKVKQREPLVAYLRDPMPDTCLAVEAETMAASDALTKAVDRIGDVLRYDLPKKYELAGWVRERGRARHLTMSLPVARHLLALVGDEPERLESEIEKLATYCGRQEPTIEDIDAVCTPGDEVRVYELMDAVGNGDRERAFTILETLFASGDQKDAANPLLYMLLRHVRLLEQASQLGATDATTAAKQLGVAPYRARRLLEQRGQYDRRRLGRAYRALADAEAGMRGRAPATLESAGGVNHGDRLVLELALARLLS